jgi:uncharacterized membrane protein YfcA
MSAVPNLVDVALFAAGFVSWVISTLAAGGGSVLIVAAVALILRGQAIAPVVTMTSLLASPARMILLWRFIDWRVVRWYLPGATMGALLGGWTFAHINTEWLQIVLALFLISTAWQYRMGVRPRSFAMRLPWFLPVSFASGTTSAMVGASGLLVNPFYLNYGLMKEAMLATRAVNSLAIQLVKISAYVMFGVLHWRLARHGLIAGAGAITAIWLANPWLRRLSSFRFCKLAVVVMLFGGLLILRQQRMFLASALGAG